MNNVYIIANSQNITEGDVETQIIVPLLTNQKPYGLGFGLQNIRSKSNLRNFIIEKGKKAKSYIPDFIVSIDGVPLIVVEAKRPNEDLDEAFREAALYAGEINKKFNTKINPCQYIIACDGTKIYAGRWDQEQPEFNIPNSSWDISDVNFSSFLENFSESFLQKDVSSVKQTIRSKTAFKNPLNLLGGKFIKDKTVSNSFGESISVQYQHLFNAADESERKDIVENAYVKVIKHQSHVDPIDKLIRKKIRPSFEASIEISDNSTPTSLIEKIKESHNYNNQVLLLIGSVGSGKSTFITYLKEVALEKEVSEKTLWIRLDFNNIALSKDEIYSWIKKQIIAKLKKQNSNYDYESLAFIEQLYSENIQGLLKGPISLLDKDSMEYKKILVEKILSFQDDLDLTLNCYIKLLVHEQNKNLIIILDNCDKRSLDDQLLMFNVANWVKDNIRAIVFLPLRDTTFDLHRNKQPLDTVIKDMTFRINPPSLKEVIYERIKYAMRLSEKTQDKFYFLSNGWKVTYPSEDEISYLKSILTSLFQNNFFKQLISGLAGRDIRKGIEIFLDFCKSGHITDSEIVKMKQTKGVYSLPPHIVARVFMRGNRVYYSSNESRIKNIFALDPTDDLPDPFIRISILKWLDIRRKEKSSSGVIGFFKVSELVENLTRLGHSEKRIMQELNYLINSLLIVNESQENTINADDLIAIDLPGNTHLTLIKHADYLAACGEDFWYKEVKTAELISSNLAGEGKYSHMSMQNVYNHSYQMFNALKEYYESYYRKYLEILPEEIIVDSLVNFENLENTIQSFKEKISFDPHSELEPEQLYKTTVVAVKPYGIMCKVELGGHVGLISNRLLPDDFQQIYSLGDVVFVSVLKYNSRYKKYDFSLNEIDSLQ